MRKEKKRNGNKKNMRSKNEDECISRSEADKSGNNVTQRIR